MIFYKNILINSLHYSLCIYIKKKINKKRINKYTQQTYPLQRVQVLSVWIY